MVVGSNSKNRVRVITWSEAPKLSIPEKPAIIADCNDLWLAYETRQSDRTSFAVVRFSGLIDVRLSAINDEGLSEHPYSSVGLKAYEFNELFDTHETRRWSVLSARHFVITFKDFTIEVISTNPSVVATDIRSKDADTALQAAMRCANDNIIPRD